MVRCAALAKNDKNFHFRDLEAGTSTVRVYLNNKYMYYLLSRKALQSLYADCVIDKSNTISASRATCAFSDFLPNFFAPLCEGEGGAEKISLKRLQQQKNIVHTLPFKAPDGEEIFIEIAFVG